MNIKYKYKKEGAPIYADWIELEINGVKQMVANDPIEIIEAVAIHLKIDLVELTYKPKV